ncbi:MAG: hypothetical protein LBR07_01945 [Puniceicoccales bacterium]|nr:hypothetical protein [Puniceicoccales bacterium]
MTDIQTLSFGPDWATSTTPRAPSAPKHFKDGDSRSFGGDRPRRGFGGGGFGGDNRGPRRDSGGNRPPRREGGNFGGGTGGGSTGGTSGTGGNFGGAPRQGGNFGGGNFGNREGGRGFGGGGFGGGRGRGPRRDDSGGGGDSRPPRRGFGGGWRRGGEFPTGDAFASARPSPIAEITFYPEEKPFGVLVKAIKSSMRTYDLFEIASLILEKPERFVVACRPFNADRDPNARLWQSVPDQLPFLSEQDAVAHVLHKHLDKFFERETVTVEPPKGNFLMVSRCGMTGEILGAPNHHAYQQTLREHHAARLPSVPFLRFTSRIESVRDKEQIDAWLQRMTQATRYKVLDRAEGEPEHFDTLQQARAFLLEHRRDKVVRATTSVRFPGKALESLPFGPLRSAIDTALEDQRYFPLVTSNSLRGRLRKLGFVLYKRSSKDVTLVSIVERKFRVPGTIFAESIQRVFDFVEETPYVNVLELPERFLGLRPRKKKQPRERKTDDAKTTAAVPAETAAPAAPAAEAEPPVTAEAPAATEATPLTHATTPETTPATTEAPVAETPVAETPSETSAPAVAPAEPTTSAPAPTETPTAETTPATTGDAAGATAAPAGDASAPAEPPAPAEPEDAILPETATDSSNPAVRELLQTLRWLVSEGYVTEFSDGRLYANPVLSPEQLRAREAAAAANRKANEKNAPLHRRPNGPAPKRTANPIAEALSETEAAGTTGTDASASGNNAETAKNFDRTGRRRGKNRRLPASEKPPATTPSETPSETSTEPPAETPAETPAQQPAEPPAEQPAATEQSSEHPASTEPPAEQPAAETPAEQPAGTQTPVPEAPEAEAPTTETSLMEPSVPATQQAPATEQGT